ncbi:MAG: hypothetical protein M3174_07560 [Actinomycetota bacterium]|nr:hypothetical protein [Actinomycetota bacterium]
MASLATVWVLVSLVPSDEGLASHCAREECTTASSAQRRGDNREETLLDKVGLGSLRDISWEAVPAALALAALIGAAGGFVYSGIVGQDHPAKKQETDRPNS